MLPIWVGIKDSLVKFFGCVVLICSQGQYLIHLQTNLLKKNKKRSGEQKHRCNITRSFYNNTPWQSEFIFYSCSDKILPIHETNHWRETRMFCSTSFLIYRKTQVFCVRFLISRAICYRNKWVSCWGDYNVTGTSSLMWECWAETGEGDWQ